MGKLVLGIIAVIALQLAFSVYIAYDEPAAGSSTVASNKIQENPVTTPAYPSVAADPSTIPAEAEPETAAIDHPTVAARINNGRRSAAEPRTVKERTVRSLGKETRQRLVNVHYRRPVERDLARARPETTVEREYFGSLLVERRYGSYVPRNKSLSKPGINRQYFGRMVVETRS